MTSKTQAGGSDGEKSRSLTVSRSMSAPTVKLEGRDKVSGSGLALAGVTVEQDAAYWEWHIELSQDAKEQLARQQGGESSDGEEGLDGGGGDAVKFGLATKKDAKFYRALEANEEGDDATPVEDGTALMRAIPGLQDGDTVGVAVQHSDLPMIQFLLNGEPLHELAINRFRGAVYPSVYLREGVSAKVVFDEDEFKEMSPHARFGPLIVARGII